MVRIGSCNNCGECCKITCVDATDTDPVTLPAMEKHWNRVDINGKIILWVPSTCEYQVDNLCTATDEQKTDHCKVFPENADDPYYVYVKDHLGVCGYGFE